MAFVGLRHPVFAPLTTEKDGTKPVYGKGVVIGRAMTADIEFTRNSNKLYADDTSVESDNSITGGSVTFGVDDISEEAQVAMLGATKEEGTNEYIEYGDSAPYGGLGYMRVRVYKGVTSYIGYWIYKTQFAIGAENAQTKGENVEWQTPTISGNVMGIYPDSSGKPAFRSHKEFATAEEAQTWIDTKAGITA